MQGRRIKIPVLKDFDFKEGPNAIPTRVLLAYGLVWTLITVMFMYMMLLFCVANIEYEIEKKKQTTKSTKESNGRPNNNTSGRRTGGNSN